MFLNREGGVDLRNLGGLRGGLPGWILAEQRVWLGPGTVSGEAEVSFFSGRSSFPDVGTFCPSCQPLLPLAVSPKPDS